MTPELSLARKQCVLEFRSAIVDGWVTEAHAGLNDANRELIATYARVYGEAWLGQVNHYGAEERRYLWKWDGSFVFNFGADFVLPHDDEEIRRLLAARERTPYTGAAADGERLHAIFARIALAGGDVLFWT